MLIYKVFSIHKFSAKHLPNNLSECPHLNHIHNRLMKYIFSIISHNILNKR